VAGVLVDSSIWIAIEHERYVFPDLIAPTDDIAVCPIVMTEVLRGARSLKRYDMMRNAMMQAIVLDEPTPLERFEQAARIYLQCRNGGITPATVDCLIAACGIAYDIPLLTFDADFTHIARYTALRLFTRS
jgi:predicted nucleic acid-binding protein